MKFHSLQLAALVIAHASAVGDLQSSPDMVQCDVEDSASCAGDESVSLLQNKLEVLQSSDEHRHRELPIGHQPRPSSISESFAARMSHNRLPINDRPVSGHAHQKITGKGDGGATSLKNSNSLSSASFTSSASIASSASSASSATVAMDTFQKVAEGLATLYTSEDNDLSLLVDLTEALKGDGTIMVTALAEKGVYLDGYGTLRELYEPLEQVWTQIFNLKLSKDKRTVDVLQPQLGMRTSDLQTEWAWEKGVNSPWVGYLNVVQTSLGEDRVVVDGLQLITSGFFVTSATWSFYSGHLTRVKAFPSNFDVSLKYLDAYAIEESCAFSVIRPPEPLMTPRRNDDRLPYFAQNYVDLGVHTTLLNQSMVDPKKAVDPAVGIIWKYDLQRLKQIRIYVDPTVPERWHQSFKKGIEAWNDAFVLAGYSNNAIRGVLPSDPDWPKDYDAGDARFSTINWAIDSSQIFSMGIAKVDARSGEILKSDIIMGAGWVKAWLNDWYNMKVHNSHNPSFGFRSEKLEKKQADQQDPTVQLHADGEDSKEAGAQGGDDVMDLLGASHRSLLASGLPQESWYEVVEAGIAAVVTHEVGHVLGLRHNFKGSVGVSYDCTQNMTCSAEHGLTASIMDYVPMNLPSVGKKVHYFTPVVGAYDKLAIQYGYTHVDPAAESIKGVPTVPEALKPLLREAEQWPLCIDEEYSMGLDPLCAAYDFSSEPLRYFEDQVVLLQKLQSTLLDHSVKLGEPYFQFGSIVLSMLGQIFWIQDQLTHWVGGMNVSYVHRSSAEDAPVQPISEEQQLQAVRLLFKLCEPGKNGLIPSPDLLSKLAIKDGGIHALDLNAKIRSQQEYLIKKLLSSSTLKQIELSRQHGGLSVGNFLEAVIELALGAYGEEHFWKSSTSLDWDLQMFAVQNLALQREDSDPLPESIEPTMLMAIESATQVVDNALDGFHEKLEIQTQTGTDEKLLFHLLKLKSTLEASETGDGVSSESTDSESTGSKQASTQLLFLIVALAMAAAVELFA